MADYKIANIKWLRDRGWSIPSSYADELCPTYKEIVNEIPKGSITVDVSGTYSNNQLVCEKDINIITGKFVTLTLNNGDVIDIDGSGALTTSMVRDYQQTTVKAEIGTLCTSLEGSVFTSFENLTGATISDTVTSIGINPFVNCTSLTSIIIDSNNTTYDSRNNCNAIIKTSTNTLIQGCKSTVIPNTVTSIGQNAFMAQKTLTGITIPNSVTSIDVSAFQACEGLTNMVIPNSVTTIGNSAFSGCKNIITCTMGNGVTSIGSGAFAGCTSLTSITIPESVTYINGGILTACTSLERITVERVAPPTIEDNTFDNTNDCPIYVPCESVDTYKTSWSQYADRITCYSIIATLTLNNGSTVDIEGSGELKNAMIEPYKTTVTRAEIKDTCTSIGASAFYNCSLTSIEIPSSVTSIGAAAFYYCTSLTSVTISDSVTSIGNYTFEGCTSLTSVTIPNSVTSIGTAAFQNCSSLTSVTIPNSVTYIGESGFTKCTSLTNVTLPNSVTTIGRGVFVGCTSLTSMTFPSSVTNIGAAVLTACTSLERITVERVEPPTIEENTFDSTNDSPIYVPCESANTYKTSWSQYADRIICKATDCSDYNWLDLGTSVGKESGTVAIANYINSYGDIVWRDKPEWITAITQETGRLPRVTMVKATYEASSVDRRVGRVNFISQNDGCTFSASLTQVNAVGVTVNWYAQRTEWGEGQYGGYYYTTVSDEELPFTLSVTPSLGTTPYGSESTCHGPQQATSSFVHFKKLRESAADYTDYYAGDNRIFCSDTIIMLTTTVSGDVMIIRNGVNVTINGIVYNFTWINHN